MAKKKRETRFYFEVTISGCITAANEQSATALLNDTKPKDLENLRNLEDVSKDIYLEEEEDDDYDE